MHDRPVPFRHPGHRANTASPENRARTAGHGPRFIRDPMRASGRRWAMLAAIAPLAWLDAGAVREAVDAPTVARPARAKEIARPAASVATVAAPDPVAGWIVDGAGHPIADVEVTRGDVRSTSDGDG